MNLQLTVAKASSAQAIAKSDETLGSRMSVFMEHVRGQAVNFGGLDTLHSPAARNPFTVASQVGNGDCPGHPPGTSERVVPLPCAPLQLG